jgi:hypothetical protein
MHSGVNDIRELATRFPFNHSKVFPKRQFSHDIKGQIVCPFSYIHDPNMALGPGAVLFGGGLEEGSNVGKDVFFHGRQCDFRESRGKDSLFPSM